MPADAGAQFCTVLYIYDTEGHRSSQAVAVRDGGAPRGPGVPGTHDQEAGGVLATAQAPLRSVIFHRGHRQAWGYGMTSSPSSLPPKGGALRNPEPPSRCPARVPTRASVTLAALARSWQLACGFEA